MVAVLAVLALIGACSGGGDEATDETVPPTTTTTTVATTTTVPPPPPTYPLTGLPVDDPAKAARPAAVVKVENSRKSHGRQRG